MIITTYFEDEMADWDAIEFLDRRSVPDKSPLETILEYLEMKERLSCFDPEEELVLYPELYNMCPPGSHECLHINEDRVLRRRVWNYWMRTTLSQHRTPILSYVNLYNFVEIYLDDLGLKRGVPEKIFLCRNLRVLSLKRNKLRKMSPNIGRLKNLEVLKLSQNRLRTDSLPYTLKFCYKLHTLHVDENEMLMVPGFLLEMRSLKDIRRLDSKSNIRHVWPALKNRIRNAKYHAPTCVLTLQELSARELLMRKIDYFSIDLFPVIQQDVISAYINDVFICDNCINPRLKSETYQVVSLKFDHLGNYVTIFAHRACSLSCAEELYRYLTIMENNSKREYTLKYNKYLESEEVQSVKEQKNRACCIIS